jgi:integral membrane protein
VSALRALRVYTWLEGASLLLLVFVGMPLKHWCGLPVVTRVLGGIHGLLFLLFVSTLLRVASERQWSRRKGLLALASSLIPGGSFWLDHRLKAELARGREPAGR